MTDESDNSAPASDPSTTETSNDVDGSDEQLDVETDSGASTGPSDLDDVILDNLDAGSDDPSDEASRGLFDDLLEGEPIFENKEVLRPSYTPHKLPHREEQINNMATILVTALRGDTPSNILIYGKTGTGKTASAKFVSEELETTSQKYEVPCEVEYINCEVTDTQYRVLAQLANKFIDKNAQLIDDRIAELEDLRSRARENAAALEETAFDSLDDIETEIESLEADKAEFEEVPMTGWPTDRVYSSFFDAVDYHERVVVIMLDEIDKLVEKSGDDTLYNLSRMNSELENSRVSIMGISNDLKFTDFLDPRVKSSLGEEEIVFPPYDANQLRDILQARSDVAFKGDALTEDVIPLCAAFAAQEHGDARRALDLLRTAGELAERDQTDNVLEDHVRQAQEKIELDRVVEVVRTLPTQSKIVLFAIILLEKNGVHNINTGEVFNIYKNLCEEIDADILTQRRVTDLISELDMLGIVNAVVVSKGRYGRTKEISLSVPTEETEAVLLSDSRLGDIDDVQPFVQARFDN
ncbi:cell division control protein Cdc6 [Haloarcula hispanica N601]|uniref:ORC1-type DNA replication protein n=2 Tax=Haloarcula hispanica TaxID=51589 RepID=V5TH92_HALHI|nr:ORC1-type DNA replication protein [Haloarcula hispanica]AEM55638.1 putative cell division control protein 6 [Haloarcula hispanica ATCC 33960]AHB64463.1 cell division control protein Cdc6 [Haloarcula hispanica N601]